MIAADRRLSQPSRAAAPTSRCCHCWCHQTLSAVARDGADATTREQIRKRRFRLGQNRTDEFAERASHSRSRGGRARSRCIRLPSLDWGASGFRRARRRKDTTGTRARTDMVSFMPRPNGEMWGWVFCFCFWVYYGLGVLGGGAGRGVLSSVFCFLF